MCGIFGIVLPEGEKPAAALVEKATDALYHRGPDGEGYFYDQNIALGNRRLAIIHLSEDGQMPMAYQDLRITYNGEMYNYLELREQLRNLGHRFKTKTDTEVVLAAYKEWGDQCETHFNGMWAFAIYDMTESTLFCSRDRFGIKPFFYSFHNEQFTFASEIKALKTLPNWRPKVNEQMASDFLIHGIQHHTNQTLYKGIFQLPAGHQLSFDCKKSELTIRQYYDLEAIPTDNDISFKAASQQLKSLLKEAIHLHRRSDVNLGAALSGGLDSSTIVAIQAKLFPEDIERLETVSYASTIPAFDESQFVDNLLKKYPVKLHRCSSGFEETMRLLDEVTMAHDEPLLSASLIAQYLVFKTAKKQGLKVMLDGQGADEILAGYGTYYKPFWKELLKDKPWLIFSELLGVLKHHNFNFISKLKQPRAENIDSFFYFSTSDRPLINHDFHSYERYMITTGILPYLLHFEDRNSMAHSVESRVPFLDYRLVEFCLSLPAIFKIKKGVRKRILRTAMHEDLPPMILNRFDKMGFPTPQNHWMSEQPDYFLEKISKLSLKFPDRINEKYYNFAEQVLRNKQTEHYSGIWRMISFFRWMELENL